MSDLLSADPYSQRTRDYFAGPAHAGRIDGPLVGYYEDAGLRLQLSAVVNGSTISTLRFHCWGCPHSIAAGEWFCRQFEGLDAAELESFNVAQVMSDLGVPVEKTGRILALEDTVRSLAFAIRNAK